MNDIFFDNIALDTNRLLLKVLDPTFAGKVIDYYKRNKDFFQTFLPNIENFLYDEDYQTERLWKEFELLMENKAIRFYIFKKKDFMYEQILGDIAIANIIRGSVLSCTIAYNLDYLHTDRGYMTEALRKVIDFIFTELKLHKIEAYIQPVNKPSIDLIKRLDFVSEGTARDYMFIKGKWVDHERYVLLNK